MPIKTSLRNEVINRLPYDKKKGTGIYHRPLVGSGILLKGGINESINKRIGETRMSNGKRILDTGVFRQSEYENPNVNALQAFETTATDNFFQTRRLVLTFNHPNRRDVNQLSEYRKAYWRSLEACNLCYDCDKPIKVRKARIEQDSRKKPDPFFAEEVKLDRLEKRIDGGKKIRSSHGVQLRGIRYKSHSKGTNTTYGEIKSHFEYVPFRNEDGEIKYRFVYIDGSERRIESRRRPGTNIRYFVHVQKDGTETKIIPQKSYRITGRVCKCKRTK